MSAPRMADRSQNADFVPPWMADLGLVAGPNGWLNSSKAQLRAMQRPDQTLNVRVWATGMLHAPGYNGQEALIVRTKNGPKEPLRPSDIVRELFVEAKKYYVSAGIKATDAEWERLKEPREAIREAMSQLEEYGVAQRTDGKGTPFEKLSIEERQRLPSGRTRMFFWLFPRNANPARVRQEWEQFQKRQRPAPPTMSPDDVPIVDVGKSALPIPPIWQILKVFQIEKPEKSIINDPDYQQRVERARVAAQAVFLEVVLQPLPRGDAEVGPQAPPEVVLTAGALESKVERDVAVRPVSAVPASSPTKKTAPQPPGSVPAAVSSSSKSIELKKEKTPSLRRNDDEKPKPEYASARDEVKAIHIAKTGGPPTVQLLDRLESIIASKGQTWDSYLEVLKRDGHLVGNWNNPPGLLTHVAQKGFQPLAAPPQEKPKPKCPRCRSDSQRGAVMLDGEIVPCPDCSTSAEWRDELAAKMKRPPVSKGGSGDD